MTDTERLREGMRAHAPTGHDADAVVGGGVVLEDALAKVEEGVGPRIGQRPLVLRGLCGGGDGKGRRGEGKRPSWVGWL